MSGRSFDWRKPHIYNFINDKENKTILYDVPVEGKKRIYVKEKYPTHILVKKSKRPSMEEQENEQKLLFLNTIEVQ